MGTLVEAPNRANVEIGGLAPVDRPAAGGGGLGTFLEGILPAVNKEIDIYQEANQDRLVALGQNDKLNKMYREVSVLDRQAYQHGRSYQDALNGQILLAQDFQNKVDELDRTNPDPDALIQLQSEYNNASVDNIHLSKLPVGMKKQLYGAQLKQNAVYTKMIDTKLKRITADNVAVTRMNSLAMLTKNIVRGEYTPEERVVLLTAHRDSLWAGMRIVDSEVSVEDMDAAYQEDVLAVMTYALTTAQAGEDGAANIAFMDDLTATVELMEGVSLKTATAISKKNMEFKAEAIAINDTQIAREVDDFLKRVELQPDSVSGDDYQALDNNINSMDNISPSAKTAMKKQLSSSFVSRYKALSSGQKLYNPTELSVTDAERMGVSSSQLISEARTEYLQKFDGDNFLAGREMINQFGLGSQYDSAGVQAGAELFARPFIGYVKMGAEGVVGDRYTTLRESNFKTFSDLYRSTVSANGSAAADLMAGIPDDLRNAFITTMQSGGSLEDVRIAAQSPVANAASYDNIRKAAGGLKADMFGLGGSPIGDTFAGRKSMSKKIQQNYMDGMNIIVAESFPDLVTRMGASTNSEELGVLIQEYQLPSSGGYTAPLTNTRVYTQLKQAKTANGAPLGLEFISQADVAVRKQLAEKYSDATAQVLPDDVIVRFNSTGEFATYSLYDTTTDNKMGLVDGKGKLVRTIEVPTTHILDGAERIYNSDSQRKLKPTVKQQREKEAATTVGTGTIYNQTTKQPSKIKLTVPYAKMVGDNVDVGTDLTSFLGDWWGFRSTPVETDSGMSYGIGANDKMVHDNLKQEFINAGKSGKPQAAIDVQAKLFESRFRAVDMKQAFQRVGVKAPDKNLYPKKNLPAVRLLHAAAYFDGNTGLYGNNKGVKGVVAAMSAPNYKAGEALFKKTKLYDPTGGQANRNKALLEQLREHYKSQGKK
jgi:hypothetical protein